MRHCFLKKISVLLLFLSLGFGHTSAQDYDCFNQTNLISNWQYLGPINQKDEVQHQRFGNVSCISVNPSNNQEIYIGSPTGGLMHTTNRGISWQSITDEHTVPIVGINDVIVDYTKTPHEILIATGSSLEWFDKPNFGILKSIDGGKNWERKNIIGQGIFSETYRSFSQVNNKIFALSEHNIIMSVDNGDTWTKILDEEKVFFGQTFKDRKLGYYYYEPTQNNLYIGTCHKWMPSGTNEYAKVFVLNLLTNDIQDLTPKLHKSLVTQKKDNGLEAIQIQAYKENQLLISVCHNASRETFVYEYDFAKNEIVNYNIPNGGNLPSGLNWFQGFLLNKKNPNIRYLTEVQLAKSTNGGDTYNNLFGYSYGYDNIPHVDVRSMIITKHSADGQSDHLYIGTDGGLSFSDNGGKSWQNLNGTSVQLTQFYGLGSSEFNGTISAGAQDNSIITYLPQENKWIHSVRGDGYDVAYSKNTLNRAYGQYNSRVIMATENDIVPFTKSMNLAPQDNANQRKTLVAHTNGDLFFASQSLFHLPKGSKQWKEYPTLLSHQAHAIAVSETDPNIIYMSGRWGDLIKSIDGGNTWEKLNEKLIIDGGKKTSRIMSICISPYDENRVWVGFGYMGSYEDLCQNTSQLIETIDGGETWRNASNGLPIFSIQDIIFYEGSNESIFAATDQGVYYRRGSAYQWQRFNTNMPPVIFSELDINYCRGKLLAATYGRGLWETDLPPIEDKNVRTIKNLTTLTAPQGEAIALTQDLQLRRRGKLIIDCPVYLPKNGQIIVRNKQQVIFTPKGKILNGCDENIAGIVVK